MENSPGVSVSHFLTVLDDVQSAGSGDHFYVVPSEIASDTSITPAAWEMAVSRSGERFVLRELSIRPDRIRLAHSVIESWVNIVYSVFAQRGSVPHSVEWLHSLIQRTPPTLNAVRSRALHSQIRQVLRSAEYQSIRDHVEREFRTRHQSLYAQLEVASMLQGDDDTRWLRAEVDYSNIWGDRAQASLMVTPHQIRRGTAPALTAEQALEILSTRPRPERRFERAEQPAPQQPVVGFRRERRPAGTEQRRDVTPAEAQRQAAAIHRWATSGSQQPAEAPPSVQGAAASSAPVTHAEGAAQIREQAVAEMQAAQVVNAAMHDAAGGYVPSYEALRRASFKTLTWKLSPQQRELARQVFDEERPVTELIGAQTQQLRFPLHDLTSSMEQIRQNLETVLSKATELETAQESLAKKIELYRQIRKALAEDDARPAGATATGQSKMSPQRRAAMEEELNALRQQLPQLARELRRARGEYREALRLLDDTRAIASQLGGLLAAETRQPVVATPASVAEVLQILVSKEDPQRWRVWTRDEQYVSELAGRVETVMNAVYRSILERDVVSALQQSLQGVVDYHPAAGGVVERLQQMPVSERAGYVEAAFHQLLNMADEDVPMSWLPLHPVNLVMEVLSGRPVPQEALQAPVAALRALLLQQADMTDRLKGSVLQRRWETFTQRYPELAPDLVERLVSMQPVPQEQILAIKQVLFPGEGTASVVDAIFQHHMVLAGYMEELRKAGIHSAIVSGRAFRASAPSAPSGQQLRFIGPYMQSPAAAPAPSAQQYLSSIERLRGPEHVGRTLTETGTVAQTGGAIEQRVLREGSVSLLIVSPELVGERPRTSFTESELESFREVMSRLEVLGRSTVRVPVEPRGVTESEQVQRRREVIRAYRETALRRIRSFVSSINPMLREAGLDVPDVESHIREQEQAFNTAISAVSSNLSAALRSLATSLNLEQGSAEARSLLIALYRGVVRGENVEPIISDLIQFGVDPEAADAILELVRRAAETRVDISHVPTSLGDLPGDRAEQLQTLVSQMRRDLRQRLVRLAVLEMSVPPQRHIPSEQDMVFLVVRAGEAVELPTITDEGMRAVREEAVQLGNPIRPLATMAQEEGVVALPGGQTGPLLRVMAQSAQLRETIANLMGRQPGRREERPYAISGIELDVLRNLADVLFSGFEVPSTKVGEILDEERSRVGAQHPHTTEQEALLQGIPRVDVVRERSATRVKFPVLKREPGAPLADEIYDIDAALEISERSVSNLEAIREIFARRGPFITRTSGGELVRVVRVLDSRVEVEPVTLTEYLQETGITVSIPISFGQGTQAAAAEPVAQEQPMEASEADQITPDLPVDVATVEDWRQRMLHLFAGLSPEPSGRYTDGPHARLTDEQRELIMRAFGWDDTSGAVRDLERVLEAARTAAAEGQKVIVDVEAIQSFIAYMREAGTLNERLAPRYAEDLEPALFAQTHQLAYLMNYDEQLGRLLARHYLEGNRPESLLEVGQAVYAYMVDFLSRAVPGQRVREAGGEVLPHDPRGVADFLRRNLVRMMVASMRSAVSEEEARQIQRGEVSLEEPIVVEGEVSDLRVGETVQDVAAQDAFEEVIALAAEGQQVPRESELATISEMLQTLEHLGFGKTRLERIISSIREVSRASSELAEEPARVLEASTARRIYTNVRRFLERRFGDLISLPRVGETGIAGLADLAAVYQNTILPRIREAVSRRGIPADDVQQAWLAMADIAYFSGGDQKLEGPHVVDILRRISARLSSADYALQAGDESARLALQDIREGLQRMGVRAEVVEPGRVVVTLDVAGNPTSVEVLPDDRVRVAGTVLSLRPLEPRTVSPGGIEPFPMRTIPFGTDVKDSGRILVRGNRMIFDLGRAVPDRSVALDIETDVSTRRVLMAAVSMPSEGEARLFLSGEEMAEAQRRAAEVVRSQERDILLSERRLALEDIDAAIRIASARLQGEEVDTQDVSQSALELADRLTDVFGRLRQHGAGPLPAIPASYLSIDDETILDTIRDWVESDIERFYEQRARSRQPQAAPDEWAGTLLSGVSERLLKGKALLMKYMESYSRRFDIPIAEMPDMIERLYSELQNVLQDISEPAGTDPEFSLARAFEQRRNEIVARLVQAGVRREFAEFFVQTAAPSVHSFEEELRRSMLGRHTEPIDAEPPEEAVQAVAELINLFRSRLDRVGEAAREHLRRRSERLQERYFEDTKTYRQVKSLVERYGPETAARVIGLEPDQVELPSDADADRYTRLILERGLETGAIADEATMLQRLAGHLLSLFREEAPDRGLVVQNVAFDIPVIAERLEEHARALYDRDARRSKQLREMARALRERFRTERVTDVALLASQVGMPEVNLEAVAREVGALAEEEREAHLALEDAALTAQVAQILNEINAQQPEPVPLGEEHWLVGVGAGSLLGEEGLTREVSLRDRVFRVLGVRRLSTDGGERCVVELEEYLPEGERLRPVRRLQLVPEMGEDQGVAPWVVSRELSRMFMVTSAEEARRIAAMAIDDLVRREIERIQMPHLSPELTQALGEGEGSAYQRAGVLEGLRVIATSAMAAGVLGEEPVEGFRQVIGVDLPQEILEQTVEQARSTVENMVDPRRREVLRRVWEWYQPRQRMFQPLWQMVAQELADYGDDAFGLEEATYIWREAVRRARQDLPEEDVQLPAYRASARVFELGRARVAIPTGISEAAQQVWLSYRVRTQLSRSVMPELMPVIAHVLAVEDPEQRNRLIEAYAARRYLAALGEYAQDLPQTPAPVLEGQVKRRVESILRAGINLESPEVRDVVNQVVMRVGVLPEQVARTYLSQVPEVSAEEGSVPMPDFALGLGQVQRAASRRMTIRDLLQYGRLEDYTTGNLRLRVEDLDVTPEMMQQYLAEAANEESMRRFDEAMERVLSSRRVAAPQERVLPPRERARLDAMRALALLHEAMGSLGGRFTVPDLQDALVDALTRSAGELGIPEDKVPAVVPVMDRAFDITDRNQLLQLIENLRRPYFRRVLPELNEEWLQSLYEQVSRAAAAGRGTLWAQEQSIRPPEGAPLPDDVLMTARALLFTPVTERSTQQAGPEQASAVGGAGEQPEAPPREGVPSDEAVVAAEATQSAPPPGTPVDAGRSQPGGTPPPGDAGAGAPPPPPGAGGVGASGASGAGVVLPDYAMMLGALGAVALPLAAYWWYRRRRRREEAEQRSQQVVRAGTSYHGSARYVVYSDGFSAPQSYDIRDYRFPRMATLRRHARDMEGLL